MSRNTGPGLYEFLMEAELQQYYPAIRGDLKVQSTPQLKYVTEEDLSGIGMTKPEMRRLKKYFQKHFPQNYLSKFKKMLLPKREEQVIGGLTILPKEKQDRPSIKVPNKHMIPADAIIVNKELGIGEFGIVQQGVWTNDGERIQVAIKCLSRERMQNNPIEFLKEAAIMHSIDHEHIVRLYGVVLDTSSLMLVTELAPLRSLLECLKEPSLRSSFPVTSLCDFAVQIADGMQYLEVKRLIHRDLAARNILVFSKHKVKISDFGLSRALGVGKDYYQTNFNVNLKLPIAWCAPECISYLKFTSASDVWAYGVTLWEMFSYGFQPWAALTGHQILEAIDEPNFQRLEQPECCPKEYFTLMLQCWQHEPTNRPKFCELINLLPDLKPELVQAVQDSPDGNQFVYHQGDVITVLDKGTSNTMWKGVLSNGKTGFFNPAHTVAYLGSNLPSNKPGEFSRGDGKNIFSSQRRKIRTDMISSPQGDLKHTGHVGLDGAYFGDISFLGGKYPHLPRQVVTPYKPQEDASDGSSQIHNQDIQTENNRESFRNIDLQRSSHQSNRDSQRKHESLWSDTGSEISYLSSKTTEKPNKTKNKMNNSDGLNADHEYHEISDEENQDSPLKFDKTLNFDFGTSLLDEMDQMFKSLGSSTSSGQTQSNHQNSTEHESSNVKNELREIQVKQSNKKKQATVKPISAADQKTLYSAIAMAQELTTRSMTDLEHPQDVSPRTPASPSRRRKFSFKLPHQHSPKPDRRHFSEEAASIPDIQACLSDEAKEVYNSLVETPSIDPSTSDTNPLRMLRYGFPAVRPRIRGNKHATLSHGTPASMLLQTDLENEMHKSGARTLPKSRSSLQSHQFTQPIISESNQSFFGVENNQNHGNVTDENPIPLPPRDRSKSASKTSQLPRHQRKHPLIIPGGGVTRTLAKMTAVPGLHEDQVDGQWLDSGDGDARQTPDRASRASIEIGSPDIMRHSIEDIERQLDSELSGLDCIPVQENKPHRCSVISEDLLEFSDNFDLDQSLEQPIVSEPTELKNLHAPTIIPEQSIRKVNVNNQHFNNNADVHNGEFSNTCDRMTRTRDHVSCEDLLEFACDGPNARRTRGPRNGEQSDEVRIMMKVLHEQSTPESCVAALNVTSWDVLAAIKLEKLQGLLRKENNFVSLQDCRIMLDQCNGDVVKAAALLRNLDDTAAV